MTERILNENEAALKELMRDQMYAGLDGNGKSLTPKYSQDPYFKKPGAGERYARWKDTLWQRDHNSIFPAKDIDTPNLIVNGNLIYKVLDFSAASQKMIVTAHSSIIPKIEAKYGSVFKYSPIALGYIAQRIVFNDLKAEINAEFAR